MVALFYSLSAGYCAILNNKAEAGGQYVSGRATNGWKYWEYVASECVTVYIKSEC
jgi:hypothetical protein